jgi:hypothetical protein
MSFKRVSFDKLSVVLLNLFIVFSVIFVNDIYSIKKILFVLILLLNFKSLISSLFQNPFVLFFGLVFPLALFMYSTLLTGEIVTSFFRSFSPYLFLLILVIKKLNFDYIRLVNSSLIVVMVITNLIVIFDLLGFLNVNSSFINDFFYTYDIGIMGKSTYFSFYYKVFLKSSPLLVILLFYYLEKTKYLLASLVYFALFLSGTRANVLIPFFMILIYFLFFSKKTHIKLVISVISTSVFLIFISDIFQLLNEILFTTSVVSNRVRIGHITSILMLINQTPLILISGSGMGSQFYSIGINAYTTSIEWAYIDLWRQMGFLFFVVFLYFLVVPFFKFARNEKYKKIAFLTYLLIAGTNPLLFSSTAYIMYIYMYFSLYGQK